MLKTQPKQLLGSLPVDFALPSASINIKCLLAAVMVFNFFLCNKIIGNYHLIN
jgi:hypothetical protein